MPSPSGYPATGKLVISRTNNLQASTFVGKEGEIWFDVLSGVLRLGDGTTPGGIIIGGGGGMARPGGPDTAVQFNQGNTALGGNASFTFNESTATVTMTGNLMVGENNGHIFAESAMMLFSNVITESYTIPAGYNALTAGPVVLEDPVVVDIPDGQRWTVV